MFLLELILVPVLQFFWSLVSKSQVFLPLVLRNHVVFDVLGIYHQQVTMVQLFCHLLLKGFSSLYQYRKGGLFLHLTFFAFLFQRFLFPFFLFPDVLVLLAFFFLQVLEQYPPLLLYLRCHDVVAVEHYRVMAIWQLSVKR